MVIYVAIGTVLVFQIADFADPGCEWLEHARKDTIGWFSACSCLKDQSSLGDEESFDESCLEMN